MDGRICVRQEYFFPLLDWNVSLFTMEQSNEHDTNAKNVIQSQHFKSSSSFHLSFSLSSSGNESSSSPSNRTSFPYPIE